MGKYTDRVGKRVHGRQRSRTIRVLVRVGFIIAVIVAILWVVRKVAT